MGFVEERDIIRARSENHSTPADAVQNPFVLLKSSRLVYLFFLLGRTVAKGTFHW